MSLRSQKENVFSVWGYRVKSLSHSFPVHPVPTSPCRSKHWFSFLPVRLYTAISKYKDKFLLIPSNSTAFTQEVDFHRQSLWNFWPKVYMAHEDFRGQRQCGAVGTLCYSSKTGSCGLSKAPQIQFFSDTLITKIFMGCAWWMYIYWVSCITWISLPWDRGRSSETCKLEPFSYGPLWPGTNKLSLALYQTL